MIRHARLLSIGALVAGALTLAGCGGGTAPTPSPTPTATTASPTATPTPSPTATTASFAGNIPANCDALATSATHQETVGGLTLQGDGSGLTRPKPDGATLKVGCEWIVGDATGLVILISTAAPAAVEAGVASLASQGYTCQPSDDFDASYCVAAGSGTQNVDTEEVIVARDDVWISQSTSNLNGRAFLSEVATQIFG